MGAYAADGPDVRGRIASWNQPPDHDRVSTLHRTGGPQDAYPDDPQSGTEIKSFVYDRARLEDHDDGPALLVQVLPRKNSRPICSGCGCPGPAYDRLDERRFEFVPLWGLVVYLAYRMRCVDCTRCGVTVERDPYMIDVVSAW